MSNPDAQSVKLTVVRAVGTLHVPQNAPVTQSSSDLALINKARALLSRVQTIDDATEVRDTARALGEYHRRKEGAEDLAHKATEIRIRAERRIGELTAAMEKAKRGPRVSSEPRNKSKASALNDAGISRQEASACEAIARIPEDRFDEEVLKPDASTAQLVRVAKEYATRKPIQKPTKEDPLTGHGHGQQADKSWATAVVRTAKGRARSCGEGSLEFFLANEVARYAKLYRESITAKLSDDQRQELFKEKREKEAGS